MFLEQQSLRTELHPFGVVGFAGNVWPLAALVVHRRGVAVLALKQIDLGDEPELGRGQLHGPRYLDAVRSVVRFGQRSALLVYLAMNVTALHRVRRIGELLLHPFEIGEARTVDELVEDARWNKRPFVLVSGRAKRASVRPRLKGQGFRAGDRTCRLSFLLAHVASCCSAASRIGWFKWALVERINDIKGEPIEIADVARRQRGVGNVRGGGYLAVRVRDGPARCATTSSEIRIEARSRAVE